MNKPLIFMDPHPRTEEMVYTSDCAAELARMGRVVAHWGSRAPDDLVEKHLGEMSILIGQTAMPKERLDRAPNLRAILNVKANWEPNIDYAEAQARGIHVLSVAPSMAPAVAEFCVGQAIALTRGLGAAGQAFKDGSERYGVNWGRGHYGMLGTTVGLIGYGNLGRELTPLLRPFGGRMLVHDPWLSDGYLGSQNLEPVSLKTLLREAKVIFVLAGVTTENEGILDRAKLELIQDDTSVVLASRAEVVEFDALVEMGVSGRLRVAIDVYPEEPVSGESPYRIAPNILFTSHIAGALPKSYEDIRTALLDDVAQILAGKPPMRTQAAIPRLAAISNSR